MFKAWEVFLEECTLSLLCGRLRCDGQQVPSYVVASGEEWARRVLQQEKSYSEWGKIDDVELRWQGLFHSPCLLVSGLSAGKSQIKHMLTLRNYIAHSSIHARKKFDDLIQGLYGGRMRLRRPAEHLSSLETTSSMTFFELYADVLETMATKVAG